MALYVRGANPIWFLVDLEGLPLNDEYWAFFLTNTLPYVPQIVTHDPEGLIPWSGDKVQFQPGGTLPNELYFNPDLVYRIEIRHGSSQSDPLIYEINNYVPENGTESQQNDLLTGDNQITNPQFQDVSFVSPYTYTQSLSGSYTVEVAPGWFLDLVGQGTTVLTQLTQSGTDDIQGNPPYAIRINNTGWTSATLRQRFNQNGAIFAGGAISMNATVRAQGTPQELTFSYVPSSPGTPVEILTADASVGTFSVLKGAVNLPLSTNNNTGSNAYVDIEIALEATGIIDITNVQLLGQSVPLPVDFVADTDTPLFKEQTIERQLDQQFHYYAPSILMLPKASLTVGWNFRNNPWQFNSGAGQTISTTPVYTADQTIVVSSAANSVTASKISNPTNLFQLQAIGAATQGQIAVFQYIDPNTFLPFWGFRFSVLVRARIVTNNGTQVKLKVRAFTSNGYPNTLSTTDPIASWDANGDPVFAAPYTGIAPENDPAYILQNNYDTSANSLFAPVCPAMPYNNFPIAPIVSSSAQVTVGIMVYTVGTLNNSDVDSIWLEEITFVPNPFAMDTFVLTADEEWRRCQYFYEKSYNMDSQPGATNSNGVSGTQVSANVGAAIGLITPFKVTKRTQPTIKWYSPQTGTVNRIYNLDTAADVTVNSTSDAGVSSSGYPNTATTIADASSVIAHWTADARLAL